MENFTPIPALIGGALIGLSAAALLLMNGRIAGISGIVGGLAAPSRGDIAWRLMFVAGLIIGAFAYRLAVEPDMALALTPSLPLLLAGGLLTGIGTTVSGGCTSGHGVCGIARLSPRSIIATVVFMVAGGATVFVMRHVMGA
ncbi:MAG: YeeE/YedE family protein [Rhodospirillaceae bacterium]|nr:YeeE/YedE family protein [Rhodospirillaceae bacterium]